MCSTSITISEESFKSDFSDFPAQAVNDVMTTGVFSRDKTRHQYSSCRSGRLKSLSLDKLPLQNVTPAFTPLDSLLTKSLLDMTRAQEVENNNIQERERATNFLKTEEDDSADQAELSATILGNNQTKSLTMLQLSYSRNLLQLVSKSLSNSPLFHRIS